MGRIVGRKRPNATVLKYYFIILLYTCIDKLYGTVYVAHMSEKGLTSFQVGQVLAAASLALSLFDYPTGNLADKFGRKRAIVFGFAIWAIGLLAFVQADIQAWFVVSIVFWAAGISLISGTPQAWLVDELSKEGKPDLKAKVFPRADAASLMIGAAVALLCSKLVADHPSFPLLLAGSLAMAAGAVLLFWLQENYGDKHISFGRAVVRNTVDLMKEPFLRMLMFRAAAARIAFQTFVIIWQLYMIKELQLPAAYLGVTMAVFMLVLAGGNFLAGIILQRLDGVSVSIISQTFIALGSLTMAFSTTVIAFYIGACLIEFGLGLDSSAASVWVHDVIPSERRATYISAMYAVGSLFGFLIPLAAGYIADSFGYRYNWLFACAGSLLTMGLSVKIGSALKSKGGRPHVHSG